MQNFAIVVPRVQVGFISLLMYLGGGGNKLSGFDETKREYGLILSVRWVGPLNEWFAVRYTVPATLVSLLNFKSHFIYTVLASSTVSNIQFFISFPKQVFTLQKEPCDNLNFKNKNSSMTPLQSNSHSRSLGRHCEGKSLNFMQRTVLKLPVSMQ